MADAGNGVRHYFFSFIVTTWQSKTYKPPYKKPYFAL